LSFTLFVDLFDVDTARLIQGKNNWKVDNKIGSRPSTLSWTFHSWKARCEIRHFHNPGRRTTNSQLSTRNE